MDKGIVSKPRPYPVAETLDRLEAALHQKGIKVFARIDQQAEAGAVGLTLHPMQLLIFGDLRAGTPLMAAHPSLAPDLPLKVLAWETDDGQIRLNYNSPTYLKDRHGLLHEPFGPVVALIEEVLRGQ